MKPLVVGVAVLWWLAVAVPAEAQPPGWQHGPAGWSELRRKTDDLTVAGKDAAVLALYEAWVAQHPTFADGYIMLAGAHESVAFAMLRGGAADARTLARTHFEAAAAELRRALELGYESPFVIARGLVDIYGAGELNDPVQYERQVRDTVKRYPTEPVAHAYLLALLASKGEPIEPAAHAARAALPPGPDARADLAAAIVGQVRHGTRLTPGLAPRLMPEAHKLVDEALALKPGHAEATRVRGDIEAVQAMMSSALPAADEVAVQGALRAIASAQATYAVACANGMFATTLADLARPAPKSPKGFVWDDLVPRDGARVLQRYGYRIEMTAAPFPGSPASCNGVPAGGSARSYAVVARPMDGLLGRTFRLDTAGNITGEK